MAQANKQQTEAAKVKEKETSPIDTVEDEGMNILEAIETAKRGRKLTRKGWSKHIEGTYLTIVRGETKPVIVIGRNKNAYTPSIEDVMANDWQEITK